MSDPRPDVVQSLVQKIDQVIASAVPPWRLYQSWREQRQLLQRARDVLSLWPQGGANADRLEPQGRSGETMSSDLLAPLQQDIRRLLQQRQQVQAEVDQLQSQRDAQRLQVMQPLIEQVEQLELFQQRADQTLQNLDRSLQFTFQALDRDMATYERAMLKRLGHLDNLSQQGEAIVLSVLQQVIQEMQQLAPAAESPPPLATLPIDRLDPAAALVPTSAAPPPMPPTSIATLGEIPVLLGLVAASVGDPITAAEPSAMAADDPWTVPGLADVFDEPLDQLDVPPDG